MACDVDFEQWEPGYTLDPHPYLKQLRENAPVVRVTVEGLPLWLVTRFDEAREALANPTLSNDPGNAGIDLSQARWAEASLHPAARHMLRMDAPDHTRLRGLVNKVFAARHIQRLRPRVAEIATELLARLTGPGPVDLVAGFAAPLPLTVISELLGVPAADRDTFAHWVGVYAGIDEGDGATVVDTLNRLQRYLAELIGESQARARRAAAGDTLVDALVAVREDGDRLTDQELLAMCFLLLVAGYETTVNLIATGTALLLRNPDQLAMLRATPSLMAPALEEFLRYEPPVKLTPVLRYTTVPTTIGGVVIPAGDPVMIALASANRDPARLAEPDDLDITRAPIGHLSFGHGPHFCIGAPLARLEAEVALSALLTTCPNLRLAVDHERLRWRTSRIVRGLRELPVDLDPVAAGAERTGRTAAAS